MATSTKKPASRSRSSASKGTKKGSSGSRAKPRGGASSRSRSRSRSGSRGGGGSARGAVERGWASLRANLFDRRIDIIGLGLVLTAVMLGLGRWFDNGGIVGNWLDAAALGLAGRALATIAPVSLFYLGVLVLYADGERRTPRIVIGMTLTWVAALGAWHLLRGAPVYDGDPVALYDAAGLLGHAISRPLAVALSVPGAVLLLLALGLLGGLIWTSTTFKEFAALIGRGAAFTTREVRGVLGRGDRDDAEAAADGDSDADDTLDTSDGRSGPRRGLLRRRGRGDAEAPGTTADDVDDAPLGTAATPEQPALAPPPPAAPGAEEPMFGKRPVATYEPPEDAPDDGLTDADRAAARIPPPIAADTVELTKDGRRKASKVVPSDTPTDTGTYELPPLDLLVEGRSAGRQSERHIAAQVQALQETFDQFRIDATVARWSRGPTVTTYEIELGAGVPVKKVANLGDDIAYALAAPDVRIVAPIPGKSAIGVEVPNRQRDRITLGDVLRSGTAQADEHPLLVALGVDGNGNPALVNLATMPHLLVSGATGSGKSVTLNAMITSVVCRARPDQVRMILVDPKRVELNAYEGVPHLLTPVVTDPKRAADAIQWAVKEMELRYDTLARLGFRNIDGYNDAVARDMLPVDEHEKGTYRAMPYILLVIDELADLMLVAPRDVEEAICRIAQMARAVGIHMVIATQRPSVDVITGLIKANIPSRLSLAVSSQTDSRTILDMVGAEKLVGHGDMLFLPASQSKPSRLQGCFVSEKEILPIIQHCVEQREAQYVEGVVKSGDDALKADASRGSDDDTDEALLRRAAMQVTESGLGSVSMLQRKLRIGFARAGRLMDELEEVGCVGPNEGSKAREVLWTPEMVEQAIDSELI